MREKGGARGPLDAGVIFAALKALRHPKARVAAGAGATLPE